MPFNLGPEVGALVLLALTVVTWRLLGTYLNLLRVRLREAGRKSITRNALPAHVRALYDGIDESLATFGFTRVDTEAHRPISTADPRDLVYLDLHWHAAESTFALVDLAELQSGQTVRVQFFTPFEDTTALLTANRHLWCLMPIPPRIKGQDGNFDNLPAQWDLHRHAAASTASPRVSDFDEARRRIKVMQFSSWVAHLRSIGWAEPAADAPPVGEARIWRLTSRGAWRYARQLARQPGEVRRALAQPYRNNPEPAIEHVRLAEMETAASVLAIQGQSYPGWLKTGLFVLTLIVSALFLGGTFGLTEALALLLVLLVHELGHLGAMRAFGYRNLSVFFLPFFGAAASGYKPHAPPWQEAIVLLAGPLPGLLLAMAALLFLPAETLPPSWSDFARALLWSSLALNLFNLLPFGILDGGRLFELAVLARFPYMRFAFAMLGVLVGLLWAWDTSNLVLGGAMLLLALALPLQWQAANIVAGIRRRLGKARRQALRARAAVTALGLQFAVSDRSDAAPSARMRRFRVAALAYPRLLQGVPSLPLSLAILMVQATALLLPVALIWDLTVRDNRQLSKWTPGADTHTAAPKIDSPGHSLFMARYKALDPQARWALLEAPPHADFQFYMPDLAWVEQERQTLRPLLPEDHPGRLAEVLSDPLDNATAVARALQAATLLAPIGVRDPADLDDERLALLVQIHTRLAREAPVDLVSEQPGRIEVLWQALARAPQADAVRWSLSEAGAQLAVRQGDIAAAGAWFARYRGDLGPQGQENAAVLEAWLLLDTGRTEAALARAVEALNKHPDHESPETGGAMNSRWRAVAGWSEMARGNAQAADLHFRAELDTMQSRLDAALDRIPWWMRWMQRASREQAHVLALATPAALDRLAALEAYDADAAQVLRAQIRDAFRARRELRFEPPLLNADGWGQARHVAHARLRTELAEPAP